MRGSLARFLGAGVTLAFLALPAPARAQQHTVSPAAMQQAVTAHEAQGTADRQAILHAVQGDEAQQLASRLGLDVTRAGQAVSTLSDTEAAALARTARDADAARIGGSRAIYISVTTLLLLLILVILIAR